MKTKNKHNMIYKWTKWKKKIKKKLLKEYKRYNYCHTIVIVLGVFVFISDIIDLLSLNLLTK